LNYLSAGTTGRAKGCRCDVNLSTRGKKKKKKNSRKTNKRKASGEKETRIERVVKGGTGQCIGGSFTLVIGIGQNY